MAELELPLSVTEGTKLLPAPGALELPIHSQCSQAREDQFLYLFFFSFVYPLFAFHLIKQMEILFLNYSVSPFDLSTSGRRLFGYIRFLKMRVKTSMEWREAFYLFFPLPAHQYSFPKQNKEINSYDIKSQQGLLLLHSFYLKINLIYKDWKGYSDILQCK